MPMSPPCPGAGWEDCLGITPLGCLPWLDVRIACDAGFENAVTVTPCQRKRDCTVLRYDAQNQDLLEFARLQSDRRCRRLYCRQFCAVSRHVRLFSRVATLVAVL